MPKRLGAKPKYTAMILILEDDRVYSAASIVRLAAALGLLAELAQQVPLELYRQRARIALGRWSQNHCFPEEGDGLVQILGQAPGRGWAGWRWKQSFRASVWSQEPDKTEPN